MIRTANIDDLPCLLEIESLSWVEPLRASAAIIANRISTYPSGQFVVEVDGKVRGVLYTQRIQNVDEMCRLGFNSQAALHTPTGKYVQLLAINVLPGKRDS